RSKTKNATAPWLPKLSSFPAPLNVGPREGSRRSGRAATALARPAARGGLSHAHAGRGRTCTDSAGAQIVRSLPREVASRTRRQAGVGDDAALRIDSAAARWIGAAHCSIAG